MSIAEYGDCNVKLGVIYGTNAVATDLGRLVVNMQRGWHDNQFDLSWEYSRDPDCFCIMSYNLKKKKNATWIQLFILA